MVEDVLLALVGMCFLPLLALCVLVLPIIALVRTAQLSRRIERVERLLERARRPARIEEEEPESADAFAAQPVPRQAPPPEERPAAARRELDQVLTTLEALVGGRALGWIAVVLLLIAAAFFLRVIIERGLIGELGRVAIGMVAGVVCCGAGYVLARRGWIVFSQMLTAAGVALLYLMTYATFGYYHLIPQAFAAPFLIAIIAESLAVAVLYESPAIALMGVIGGLLTPLLLHTDEDRYVGLFTYLAILDAGVVLLVLFRNWWASATVALAGTHGVFWLWYFERYHPAKLTASIVFQVVIFVLFLGQTILGQLVRGRPAGVEALIRFFLNAVLLAAAGYVLVDPDYDRWMGTLAVGMAIVYALVAWLTSTVQSTQVPLVLAALATSMGFVGTVFPLQAEAAWIAVGWSLQGLALWGFGLRVRSLPLRGLGAVFLAIGAGRLLLVDTLAKPPHAAPFVPVCNAYALPALAVSAALLTAAALSYRGRPPPESLDFVAMRAWSLAGFVFVGMIASIEAYDYFATQIRVGLVPDFDREERLRRTAQTALSVVWALYAVGVLLVGFRFRSRPLRWLALGVFALTLAKVVLVDTQALDGFYRVTAYFVLAIVMGIAAWAYQKVKRALMLPAPEKTS